MTFSVAARCANTGMFGVAVASSSPAVAARCAYAQAGVGAVASQNVTDPRLGPQTLALMSAGASAAQAIEIINASGGPNMSFRQVLAVDNNGVAAIHSGPNALGIWSSATASNVACGGNMLAHADVPSIMVEAFSNAIGNLPKRLLHTVRAGLAAGGEAGPIHSAGMRVVREVAWPIVDLRVDWTEQCPIEALAKLWQLYAAQMDDYVTRALNPSEAPSYGVPGDE